MDFIEVLKSRHSFRNFNKGGVEDEKIKKILELANLAPSAGNLQSFKVVVVKDRELKDKVSESALNQESIIEAPVVFVICADLEKSASRYGEIGRDLYSIQDATIFTAYLQLAATSLGLATCWVGAFNEENIKELLNLPQTLRPVAIIPLGYERGGDRNTLRKSLDEIVYKEYN
jgi:nitroreductase